MATAMAGGKTLGGICDVVEDREAMFLGCAWCWARETEWPSGRKDSTTSEKQEPCRDLELFALIPIRIRSNLASQYIVREVTRILGCGWDGDRETWCRGCARAKGRLVKTDFLVCEGGSGKQSG